MRRFQPPPDARSPNGRKTRWVGIAKSLRDAVATGRLAAGEWLPSTRELAVTFGVHRHTVQLAVDVLVAEGLLETSPRRGVVVAAEPLRPSVGASRRSSRGFGGFKLARGSERLRLTELPSAAAKAIPLHAATPDVSLLPVAELRAAYAQTLRGSRVAALASLDRRGLSALRSEIVRYLRRARALVAEDVIITHGSQEGIALVAQSLIEPGDAVAVEDPGYVPAVEAFRSLGADIVPIAVDAQGIRVDHLAETLAKRRVKLLYVTPNHQFPTTVTLSSPRRAELLALTRRHDVAIIEDDYDHEYHYRGAPQAPLAAWKEAPHVLYVGTLSKLVAPGVRVGFLAGDATVLDAVARRRELTSRGNDGVTQAALAVWMKDGGFERHLRRARRTYAARRDAALQALAEAAERVHFEHLPPDGGLAVWTRWPEHDVASLAERALERGVLVLPEPPLRAARVGHGIRVAFGGVSESDFARGLERLVEAAKTRGAIRRMLPYSAKRG